MQLCAARVREVNRPASCRQSAPTPGDRFRPEADIFMGSRAGRTAQCPLDVGSKPLDRHQVTAPLGFYRTVGLTQKRDDEGSAENFHWRPPHLLGWPVRCPSLPLLQSTGRLTLANRSWPAEPSFDGPTHQLWRRDVRLRRLKEHNKLTAVHWSSLHRSLRGMSALVRMLPCRDRDCLWPGADSGSTYPLTTCHCILTSRPTRSVGIDTSVSGPITLAKATGDAIPNAAPPPAIASSKWLPVAVKTSAALSGCTTFWPRCDGLSFTLWSPVGSLMRQASDTTLRTSTGKLGHADIWN